jgi:hypothetical protein
VGRCSRDDPRLETAVLLASDPEGVELAESAALRLPGVKRVRWRRLGDDFPGLSALVGGDRVDTKIVDAALARFPDRPHLARAAGFAARTRSAVFYDLFRSGYTIGDYDVGEVTLEVAS